MASTAETLETGSYAALIPDLGDRNVLLAMVGAYSSQTGLWATNCISEAKSLNYASLSDHDLNLCILEAL
jgi:hypothetical protein